MKLKKILLRLGTENLIKFIDTLVFNVLKLRGSKIINEKDIIMLVHGGHGFKVLKNVEMIEVKQGPYKLSADKIKFDEVDEKKIKIK